MDRRSARAWQLQRRHGRPTGLHHLPQRRTVTYHRDSQGRLTGVDASGTAAVLSTMTWSPFGPATGWTFGNGITVSRNCDLVGRPTTYTATRADQSTVQALAFGYDLRNDITALTDNAAASESQTFCYDPMQHLTSASTRVIGHDAAGNTTTDGGATLTYDARNRLASHMDSAHSASYRYNALGQRVSRTEDGVTTHYIYGLQGELLAETDAMAS